MSVFQKMAGFKFQTRWFPWVLVGVSLLAYGVMIQTLGFYWDDWEILYLSRAAAVPSDVFLFPFRPLHVLLDIVTVRLLGFHPLAWHALMLVIRTLGGWVFWKLLSVLWPEQLSRNAWAALLFVVYPSFLHQSMSVVYRQHFTTALLYLLSVWLMALAFRAWHAGQERRTWGLLILSLVCGVSHLFVTEYFAALELWRPLILLVLARQFWPKWKQAAVRMAVFWLPYLAVTAGYVVWRLVFVAGSIDDPNQAVLLAELGSTPLQTILALVQDALLDVRTLLGDSWLDTLGTDLFNFSAPSSLLIFGIVVVSALGLYWLLARFPGESNLEKDVHPLEGAWLGLAGIVLGLTPAWVIGRHIFAGRYDTRFSIPALAGSSLLLVWLIGYLIPSRRKAAAVLAVLTALAIGHQIQMTNQFRWDWERQTRVFWQIHWRAPQIEPGTALLVDRSVTGYTTTYPAAYAINLMLDPGDPSLEPDYWWFEVYESGLANRIDDLLAGDSFRARFHQISFEGDPGKVLVFNLPSAEEPTRCVWLLSPVDAENRDVDEAVRQLSQLSNLGLVTAEGNPPPVSIFGGEPAAGWCTYFQQAELAAQFGDWETVNALYQQVDERGMSSNYGHEYLPFIYGSAEAGKWNRAATLSLQAYQNSRYLKPALCDLWQSYEAAEPTSDQFVPALERFRSGSGCD